MYDDILGETEKTDEELFEEFDHSDWCTLYCIRIMNNLVEKGILVMEDGTEQIIFTDKGNRLLDKYWNDYMGREPNEEDINLGMEICKQEGMLIG